MVEARILGTAFGIATASQNMATVVSPIFTGYIQTSTAGPPPHDHAQYGYFWVEVYFILVSLIALTANITVWRFDKKKRENLL